MEPFNLVEKDIDLSIIVPVHNTELWLPEFLESLKGQKTNYRYERIFVFDSCTDGSKEVVLKSGLCDVCIECSEHSSGITRNIGLEASKGRYIWFLDSDDYLLCDTAIQEAMDFVQGERIVRFPFESDGYKREYFSMVWQYVFDRELIGDLRFRRKQPSEDDVFIRTIYKKVPPEEIKKYDKALYFYRYPRVGSNMYIHRNGEKK